MGDSNIKEETQVVCISNQCFVENRLMQENLPANIANQSKAVEVIKSTGDFIRSLSREARWSAKGAASGAIVGTGVGVHMGIAALGTAVSGVVVVPAVLGLIGGLGGYALCKKYNEKKQKR